MYFCLRPTLRKSQASLAFNNGLFLLEFEEIINGFPMKTCRGWGSKELGILSQPSWCIDASHGSNGKFKNSTQSVSRCARKKTVITWQLAKQQPFFVGFLKTNQPIFKGDKIMSQEKKIKYKKIIFRNKMDPWEKS